MNKDELRETTEKMNYMDDLLKKNIFNNPLRDVQLNMRNELIDFRTTLQKNFSELEKYIVDTCLIQETLQPKGTGEEGKINSEETQLIQKELDKKNYQILHLIRSFDEYEKTMVIN